MPRESWKTGESLQKVKAATRNGNSKYEGPSFPKGGLKENDFDLTNQQVLKLLYELGIVSPYIPPNLDYDENYWQ